MNRVEILETAIVYTTKDRNTTHGEPEDNFRIIAVYWETYLRSIGKLAEDMVITSVDVAAMMVLMKTSRLATSPNKADHWIDIAGYAACGGQCATKDVLPF